MTIKLTKEQFKKILNLLEHSQFFDLYEELNRQKRLFDESNQTQKKKDAARYATKVRQKKAYNKILRGIEIVVFEWDDYSGSAYKVAKASGVSFNTAKKYRKLIEEKTKELVKQLHPDFYEDEK